VNIIENSLLNLGFSWTMSKSLPYFLVLILGLIISIFLFKKITFKRKWLSKVLTFVLTLSFFLAYFVYSPIYEGDFSNNSIEIKKTEEFSEIQDNHLYVISIPGCPYCAQSINRMKQLQKRNSRIKIDYIVCNGDSTSLEWYSKEAGKNITVHLAENNEAISDLAKHRYPSFVFSNGNQLSSWSNDGFGVRAMDEIESKF
jgi:Uri superfamily endonuclease